MKKIFTLMLLLMGATMAKADKTIYLQPTNNWDFAGARFAVYMFNNDGDAWADFAAVTDDEGYYKATVGDDYTTIIICRMNGATTENNWDNKWTQTINISPVNDNALFTITADNGAFNETTYVPLTTYTVNFDNMMGWQSVNAYAYSGEGNSAVKYTGDWPGTQMTANGDVFTLTFTVRGTPEHVIFSNNGADQTVAQEFVNEKTYNNYVKYQFIVAEPNEEWTVADTLSLYNGVFTGTITGTQDMLFAIVKGDAIASDWSNVIRPVVASGDRYNAIIQHMNDYTTANNGAVWKVEEPATYTMTYNLSDGKFTLDAQTTVTIGELGYATYSTGRNENAGGYTITGADVFAVSEVGAEKAVFTNITGTTLPSKTGVIVKGSSFTVQTTATADEMGTNLLIGSGCDDFTITNWDGSTVYTGYILADNEGEVGFYKATYNSVLKPHKAFLRVYESGARSFFGLGGSEETAIQSVAAQSQQAETIFNLQGMRLNQMQKGLNIVGGKKLMVK